MWIEYIFLAFLVSIAANAVLRRYSFGLMDAPNARSLHTVPTPRAGGVGIVLSVALSMAVATIFNSLDFSPFFVSLAVAWLLVFSVSLFDDIHDLRAGIRLLVHGAAALLVVSGLDLPVAWWPIVVPGIVWATNLFNFMDGMDGLAAGMGLIGSLTLLILFSSSGMPVAALLTAVLAGAVSGFLPWNLPRASLFLGDAGAAPLGFLLASLALVGVSEGAFSVPVAALPFLPFVLDASLTLAFRAARGDVLWKAHREHLYQRLVLAGIPVPRILLLEWGLMLTGGMLSFYLYHQAVDSTTSWSVLVGIAVVMGLAIEWGRRRFPAQ